MDSPITDLHLHGLLSAPFEAYEAIAECKLETVPKRFESFEQFNSYLFSNFIHVFKTPEHIRAIVRAAFGRLIEDGVEYAEVSFDLMIPELYQGSPDILFHILQEERARVASRVKIGLEIGVSRPLYYSLPSGAILEKVREWVSSEIFTSIDLYDDERVGKAEDFVPLYRFTENAGLKLKAHVGEFGPASSVQHYVETLNLHSVQHGIRAADDPYVMEFLAKRKTVLNICPTSNVALGACPSYAEHPAKKLHDTGVIITINTDDFALFGATLKDEWSHLPEMGFSENDIACVWENGFSQKS